MNRKNGNAKPLDLHVLIEKEGRLYSALCLELDVASQGRTLAQAKKNIAEAIQLYLESVRAAGDEKEFIPRPAPLEEWLKYFQALARQMNKDFRPEAKLRPLRLQEMVYAP